MQSEEKLRAEYERLKSYNESPLDVADDDLDELRIALLTEMEKNSPFTVDEFAQVLDQEFSVFKEGDRYNYVKDLKDAFRGSLAKTKVE